MSVLPANWAAVSVGRIVEIRSGCGFPTDIQGQITGDLPVFKVGDISRAWLEGRSILSDAQHYISREQAEELRADILPAGSVVFAKIGAAIALNRRAILGADAIVDNNVMALLPTPEALEIKYLFCLTLGWKLGYLARATTVPSLRKSDVEELTIPLPPLAEQRRIVAEIEKQFTRLHVASASLQQARAKLEHYRTSVLGAAFKARLVPTETEVARTENREYETGSELLARILADRRAHWEREQVQRMRHRGEEPKNEKWKTQYREPVQVKASLWDLPDGWTWTTIDQITSLVTSGSRNWSAHYAEHGAVFIRAQDIKTDRLDLSSVAFVDLPADAEGTRTRVSPLDLLITITGANVTKTAMADEPPPEAYVSQHVALVRLVQPVLSRFIYYWIVAPNGGRKLLERAAYGAGKPGLNLENIRELVVPLPPVPEQARIVAELESALSVVGQSHSTVENTSIRAARLRQAILKRAFEGALVAQDPNDEPASVLLERIRSKRGAPNRRAVRRKGMAAHEELTTVQA